LTKEGSEGELMALGIAQGLGSSFGVTVQV